MKLIEIEADLFTVEPKYALAQCISRDAEMGDGIAVDFDFLFSGMKEYIIDSDPQVGQTILYEHLGGRIIFNLITKKRCFHKPTYETLESSLICMKNLVVIHQIPYLAIPRIGIGLDKLVWVRVKQIIKQVFEDIPVEILVCDYKPKKKNLLEKVLSKSIYARK